MGWGEQAAMIESSQPSKDPALERPRLRAVAAYAEANDLADMYAAAVARADARKVALAAREREAREAKEAKEAAAKNETLRAALEVERQRLALVREAQALGLEADVPPPARKAAK